MGHSHAFLLSGIWDNLQSDPRGCCIKLGHQQRHRKTDGNLRPDRGLKTHAATPAFQESQVTLDNSRSTVWVCVCKVCCPPNVDGVTCSQGLPKILREDSGMNHPPGLQWTPCSHPCKASLATICHSTCTTETLPRPGERQP